MPAVAMELDMYISNKIAGTATGDSLANLAARAAGKTVDEQKDGAKAGAFAGGSYDPSDHVSLSVEALFVLSGSRSEQRLPALTEAAVSHAWAGLYEMTPDHNPIIGASSDVDGFYTIAGFSGHGFQHAPAAGRILADLIAGRDPQFDLSPFALDRFATRSVAGEGNVV